MAITNLYCATLEDFRRGFSDFIGLVGFLEVLYVFGVHVCFTGNQNIDVR